MSTAGMLAVILVLPHAAAPTDARQVLEKYKAALMRLDHIAFEADTTVILEGVFWDKISRRWRSRCTFIRDGDRMSCTEEEWSLDPQPRIDHTRSLHRRHAILDGRCTDLVLESQTGSAGRGITTANPHEARKRIVFSLNGGQCLDGYLQGDDGLRVPEILAMASELRLDTTSEIVDAMSASC